MKYKIDIPTIRASSYGTYNWKEQIYIEADSIQQVNGALEVLKDDKVIAAFTKWNYVKEAT